MEQNGIDDEAENNAMLLANSVLQRNLTLSRNSCFKCREDMSELTVVLYCDCGDYKIGHPGCLIARGICQECNGELTDSIKKQLRVVCLDPESVEDNRNVTTGVHRIERLVSFAVVQLVAFS